MTTDLKKDIMATKNQAEKMQRMTADLKKDIITVGPNHPSNVAFKLFLDFLVSLAPNFTGSLRKVSS